MMTDFDEDGEKIQQVSLWSTSSRAGIDRENGSPPARVNMSRDNVSLVDGDFPVAVRVVLVAGGCVASTLGNSFILVTFWATLRGKEAANHRCRVVDIIIASLAATALVRGLALGPVRAACFIRGEWPLGDSLCQLQAYFEAMLRNAILWYLSLLSIERYTKHLVPHEYLVTFSPLTVNIILPGMLLIVVVQVTGPLYGWGKYEYIESIGLCGSATPSTFGCSYSLYLLFSLTLPPLLVIVVNSVLLSALACDKTTKTVDKRRSPSCADSRLLDAKYEILSLVVLMVLFVVLSVPRFVLDVTTVCGPETSVDLSSSGVFAIYFLESLTDLLLPLLCLTMHPESRKLFCEALRKKDKSIQNDKLASALAQ